MNIFIWMNYPSHHQSYFFESLIKQNVNLKVGYYAEITEERKNLGWDIGVLNSFEICVKVNEIDSFINEYSNFIHIVPGYGSKFTRKLAIKLSQKNIPWVHWSEKSTPGLRWYRSYLIKKWYAFMVNKYALGALAQGLLAYKDFRRWGIKKEIKYLSYSIKPLVNKLPLKELADFKNGRKAFLYLGRLVELKGVDLLIKAFSKLNNSDWCLIIVGDGNKKEQLKKLAFSLNISDDSIFFHPSVKYDIVDQVIVAADVFVLPSREDGWGVVLNEATSLGIPVIGSSAVGASWHIIKHDENGYRFNSNNVDDLTLCLKKYTNNVSILSRHSFISKQVFEEYSSEKMAENLIKYLEKWTDVSKIND